jgi:tetratricopeptide (TPR) repeat protein
VPASTPADPAAHLARAREAMVRKAWAEALAEARAAAVAAPNDTEARGLAQLAEAELVVDDCLRKARAALDRGDREGALEELRRGSLVRRSDPRLIELHRLVVQQ